MQQMNTKNTALKGIPNPYMDPYIPYVYDFLYSD